MCCAWSPGPGSAAVDATLELYPAQSVLDAADNTPKNVLIDIDPTAIHRDFKAERFDDPIDDPSLRAALDCDESKGDA